MVVKFQVERRPIGPDGVVYYGREQSNGVALLSHMTAKQLGDTPGRFNAPKALGMSSRYFPMGHKVVAPDGVTTYTQVVEQIGEPWLVYSSHHSVDAAISAAAPLAAAIGSDNVRIIKVLSHSTEFKLG